MPQNIPVYNTNTLWDYVAVHKPTVARRPGLFFDGSRPGAGAPRSLDELGDYKSIHKLAEATNSYVTLLGALLEEALVVAADGGRDEVRVTLSDDRLLGDFDPPRRVPRMDDRLLELPGDVLEARFGDFPPPFGDLLPRAEAGRPSREDLRRARQ